MMLGLSSKQIIAGVVVLVVAAAIVYGFLPKASGVDVDTTTRGAMEVVLEEEGRTRVVDRFVVAAPVAGVVRRIALDVGDRVEQGATLFRLEPVPAEALNPQRRAEAQARVSAAQSSLMSAEEAAIAADADAVLAATELERIRGLFEGEAATRRDVDQAEAQARRAAAQKASASFSVDVSRHNLEAAQTALRFAGGSGGGETVTVKAPIAGQVLAVHQKSENVVAPGLPIVEIGDTNRLEVAVDVLSQDATRIEPGMEVRFERWGGDGESLGGVVRTVEPVGFTKVSALGVEEQRVWVIVDFTSAPEVWRKLGDGYRVVAGFVLWHAEDVLHVPSSALFRRGDGWAAFEVDGARARERVVTVGRRSGLTVQILDGLKDGDVVVVHPPSDLEDGAPVKVR